MQVFSDIQDSEGFLFESKAITFYLQPMKSLQQIAFEKDEKDLHLWKGLHESKTLYLFVLTDVFVFTLNRFLYFVATSSLREIETPFSTAGFIRC